MVELTDLKKQSISITADREMTEPISKPSHFILNAFSHQWYGLAAGHLNAVSSPYACHLKCFMGMSEQYSFTTPATFQVNSRILPYLILTPCQPCNWFHYYIKDRGIKWKIQKSITALLSSASLCIQAVSAEYIELASSLSEPSCLSTGSPRIGTEIYICLHHRYILYVC